MTDGGDGNLRLDKWLWFARFFKTRSLATKYVQSGKLRVNTAIIAKPHYAVKIGDVLTFPMRAGVKVVKVLELGARRGPAPEAQALYEDLSPPPPPKDATDIDRPGKVAPRDAGSGRPTKRERRETDRLRGEDADA
ncbi:MAG TPA: RNA-binding protein S4 [Rhodospirillaceae bacterium]|nr:RNA-binding protein S4 [Magnetovibrio sp.]HCS69748.1 RNA-binding protein S4 [Rhodospirillaceae bacterium]|tara:strand:+ start:2124 stop:2531 length:408 start_codon:yes stop_codon:yes gene_type:complete